MPVAPDDPRLQQCGFARLLGDQGVDYVMRKYEIILGRKSKSTSTDVVLGDVMSVSREHAKIYYNFNASRWEMEVIGKNGIHVDGTGYQAGDVVALKSQSALRVADLTFYFLLPRDYSKAPATKKRKLALASVSPVKRPMPQPPAPAAGTGTPTPAVQVARQAATVPVPPAAAGVALQPAAPVQQQEGQQQAAFAQQQAAVQQEQHRQAAIAAQHQEAQRQAILQKQQLQQRQAAALAAQQSAAQQQMMLQQQQQQQQQQAALLAQQLAAEAYQQRMQAVAASQQQQAQVQDAYNPHTALPQPAVPMVASQAPQVVQAQPQHPEQHQAAMLAQLAAAGGKVDLSTLIHNPQMLQQLLAMSQQQQPGTSLPGSAPTQPQFQQQPPSWQ